jgi:hypothetical protein
MKRIERFENKFIRKAILEAPKFDAGEEFYAFPDAARGIDEKVIIKETVGRAIQVTDGRIFTKEQLLTPKEAAVIRRKFAKKIIEPAKFAN